MNIVQTFSDNRPSICYEAITLHYLLKISSSAYGKNDQCAVYKANVKSGYYIYYSINVADHYLLWDEQANNWAHIKISNLTLNTHYPFKTINNYEIIVNRPPTHDPHLHFFDSSHHNVITFKGSTFTRTRPYTRGYVEYIRDLTISTPMPASVIQTRQLDNTAQNLRHNALLLATLMGGMQLLFVVQIDDTNGICTLGSTVDADSPSFLRPGYIFWIIQDILFDLMVVKAKHFLIDDIPTIASGSLLTDFDTYGQLVLHTFKIIDVGADTTLPLWTANIELIGTTAEPITITLPASAIDGFIMQVINHTDGVVHMDNLSIPIGFKMEFQWINNHWITS